MPTLKSLFVAALAAAAGVAAAATNVLPGPAFPNFENAEQVKAACDRGLAASAERVQRLEHVPGGPRWLAAFDDLNAFVEDQAGPIYLLSNVHPDKAVRDATEACELRWQDFSSTLAQNETLYRAARQVRPRDDIDREFLKTTLDDFVDAGVSLPPAQRKRAKAI